MKDYNSEYQSIIQRWGALQRERSSWMSHYQELSRYFLPRVGKFLTNGASGSSQNGINASTPNDGTKKHQHILDNSQLRSVDVATAGLVAGMTSPARPWFRLQTPDEKLNEKHSVKKWLSDLEQQMRNIYAHSNTYRSYRRIYEEILVFGTGASIKVQDYKDVVRHFPMTVGEYAISTDDREVVDTLYRQFSMTAAQLVGKFGFNNCSKRTQDLYTNKNLNAWIDVIHAIEPRRERDPLKIGNDNMPWKSVYVEVGNDSERNKKFLRESGFKNFPALVPRWKINGHDFYGEAPAMRALGDVKTLQQEQYRKAQAIDYQTQPPLQVPSSLMEAFDKSPGGVNVVDMLGQGIKSAWDVKLNLQYLLNDIMDVRQRIAQAMFEDMFLMFTTSRRGVQPPTAEEISAQQEEKLLMIGPVLENLHDEMLTPDIESTFQYMIEANIVPPAPPEMHGQPLIVKFVSTLAQAQRLIGLNSLDRMIGTVMNLAQIKPDAVDKLDGDAIVDSYSDVLGIDPDLIVANDKVALIRADRAKNQERQAQMAAAPEAAKTAKTLGETNVQGAGAALGALQSLGGTP
jgi:hypothetical protein